VIGDIRDTDALISAMRRVKPAVVVHLAAIHFIPLCDAQPRLAIDINVGGTQSVLDACGRVDTIEGVVFASTGAVYGPSNEALREDSALAPTDVYGHTKLWGEQLLALHRARTGAGVAVARLFNVYGPRETNPHFIPSVLLQVAQGGDLQLGNLSTRRDYVYAEDVARAISALAEQMSAETEITCNVGTGVAHAGAEILREIASIVHRDVVPRQDHSRLRSSDRPVLWSDPRHARDLLGWTARMPLGKGLERAFAEPVAAGVEIT
jgi:UDP-glucose 4-epimerase